MLNVMQESMNDYKTKEEGAKYVDLLTNSGFKALFGDENNKEVVMSIIDVLLPEHRHIVDIEYMQTEHQGQLVDSSKEMHYDFMCRDSTGVVFIVEMQNYHDHDWFKRCVSYACRAYDRQNRKGETYDVPPVYLIGLMGVDVGHPDKEFWKSHFISEYTFREKQCHDLLDETIFIIFAELADFHKTDEECVTHLDRMLYLLKNIGRMDRLPDWIDEEIYSHIATACYIAGFDEEKRIRYEKDMYDERRYNSEMNTARMMGIEEGMEKGKLETAKELKALGVDIEIIVKSTGLSIEQINSL